MIFKTLECLLQWNISDNFFQNRQRIKAELDKAPPDSKQQDSLPPFDALWMCLFQRLGDLCVDSRPAVRKSAGQTLFSTVSAHGALLQQDTWRVVLWKVRLQIYDLYNYNHFGNAKERRNNHQLFYLYNLSWE